MLDELLLLSGNDIPFPGAQVTIHPPTLREIAYINEKNFFLGCEFLNFSKESLPSEDKINLQNQSNFDIIMSMMKVKNNKDLIKNVLAAHMVLTILFPNYTVQLLDNTITLKEQSSNTESCKLHYIDNSNFNEFQEILIQMCCLNNGKVKEYNPSGDLAQKIADKLAKRKQQLAKEQPETKINILSLYSSILAVGEHKDLNSLMQYTVYQLFDEFQRFKLKTEYDQYIQAIMAGAKDLKEIENWMKDIHI